MDFNTYTDQAWADHGDNPAAVAATLRPQGLPLVQAAEHLLPMANLAQHVLGSHLGRWQEALEFLDALAALPFCEAGSPAAQGLQRHAAALRLAAGGPDERAGRSASEQVRITAMAAAALVDHDVDRATALLQEAVDHVTTAAFADDDPVHRSLAVTSNNLAAALEEKPQRSEADTRLMIQAAQAARRHWALAGTWLETERAEYRLARCWRAAGNLAQARQHAQNCLEIVQANGHEALEAFFGWEVLGLVERDSGNATGHAQAVAQAEAAFARLSADDQGWCRASLDSLKGS